MNFRDKEITYSQRRRKLCGIFGAMIFLLMFMLVFNFEINYTAAQETEAEALTLTLNAASGNNCDNLLDDAYTSTVSFSGKDELTVTGSAPMQGIYIKWAAPGADWRVSYNGKTVEYKGEEFLHHYIDFGETADSCTIYFDSDASVCDLFAYGEGTLPSNVQIWEKPCERADILVFSTHADDEILFLGGVLATHAGQQGLNVQVAYMTNYWNGAKVREHEKLDGLWESGVRNYPVNGDFDDIYAESLEGAMSVYSYDDVLGFVTEQIRRFKPLVCVTQDLNGEYGHGGHMLLAEAVCEAVDNSADASFNSESAEKYGIWDVPKTYLHLYGENKITMDLRVPLDKMNNRTAVEVASDAYLQHISQQWCWFYVSDDYEYSCADFGLYRTTVGNDTGNDMLENITTYEEQESIAESSRAAEEESRRQAEEALNSQSKDGADTQVQSSETKSSKVLPVVIVVLMAVVLLTAVFAYSNYMNRRRRRAGHKGGQNGSARSRSKAGSVRRNSRGNNGGNRNSHR